MPLTPVEIAASNTSALNDGVSVVVDGATKAVGGVTPPDHAHLRFDTSTIADTDHIVNATLTLTVATTPATVAGILWASEFGAAIAIGDYGVAASNTSPIRVQLAEHIPSGAIVGSTHSLNIPARFINKLASVNSGFSDFELRTGSDWTSGAGNLCTIHGSSAATPADRPTLTYVALTDTELANGEGGTYRYLAIGAESYLAFDVETTPGVAVKPKVLLDVTQMSLDSYAENLASAAFSRNRIRPRKMTVGRAGAGGGFTFELTPEKCWKLLLGMFTVATTGAGPTYDHVFTVGQSNEIKTFTFAKKEGAFRSVFPGAMLSSLNIGVGLDQAIMASADVMCREEWIYDESSAGADDEYILSSTAGYDTLANSVLSFIGASVTLDGESDPGLIQNVSVSFDQTVNERRGLNRSRFVAGHYPSAFVATVNFDMEFENDRQFRKFLGDNTQDYPYRAGECLQFQEVVFTFRAVCGNEDFICTITVDSMSFNTVRKNQAGEDAITLSCSGTALLNGSDYVTIEVTNTESSYVPSTDVITVLPEGVEYPS